MTPSAAASRPLLLTLVLLTTVTAIVSSLGAPLVPAISADLGVSLADAQWTLTATLVTGAMSTPIIGRLGSGRLRRPTVLVGLVVVTLGTVLAALPLGFVGLVTGRAMQGVGLALVPLALAIARDVVPARSLSRTLAFLSVTTVAGAGLGYPVTALVAQVWGLSAAFWLGAVLSGLTLAMAVGFVPRDAGDEPSPVDWLGSILVALGLVGVLLAGSRGEIWGWRSPVTLGFAACGSALLVLWVRRTLRSSLPLVDLRLAARPGLLGPNLVAMAAGFGMYSLLTLVMVLVQADGAWGLGHPVTVAGFALLPYAVTSVLGAQVARRVGGRFGDRVLLPIGCLTFLSANLWLTVEHDRLWQVLACMGLAGLGSGFTFSSLPALMVPHVPRAETGSAMAFNQVLRYVGFSIGSASSVTLLVAFGSGESGFRGAMLVSATVWLAAAVASGWLGRQLPWNQSSR